MKSCRIVLIFFLIFTLIGCSRPNNKVISFIKFKKNIEKAGIIFSANVKVFFYGTSEERERYYESWILFSSGKIKLPIKGMPWDVQDATQNL